jgi:hypothetical protein
MKKNSLDVIIKIYTKTISKQLKLDVNKYNSQYRDIDIKKFSLSHDLIQKKGLTTISRQSN